MSLQKIIEENETNEKEKDSSRNDMTMLDGILRDSLSAQQFLKYIDSISSDSINILSENSKIGNNLSIKVIEKGLTKDIAFFDAYYFKTRGKA